MGGSVRDNHNIALLLGLKSQTSNSMIVLKMELYGTISGVLPETCRQRFRGRMVLINIHVVVGLNNFCISRGWDMNGFFIMYIFNVLNCKSCDFFEIPGHGDSQNVITVLLSVSIVNCTWGCK